MALVITDEQNYEDIAGAIRLKLNVETTYLPSEMAAAIGTIDGGGGAGFPASSLVGVGHAEYDAGKNLLSQSGLTNAIVTAYGEISSANPSLSATRLAKYITLVSGETYTLSNWSAGTYDVEVYVYDSSIESALVDTTWVSSGASRTFTVPSNGNRFILSIRKHDNSSLSASSYAAQEFQLEEGSTATSYEAYRAPELSYTTDAPTLKVIHNGAVSSIDLPLPTRGWAGSLPNGIADTMTLDGQGNVAWTLNVGMTTTAVTDGITGTLGTDILSSTGVLEDGATVLYPLATPTTETDTVTLPSISGGDTVRLVGLVAQQTATA